MPEKIETNRLDANESAFFERELEFIKSKTYDIRFPELKGANGRLIPISTEAGPWADEITYQQFDMLGMGKIIASYADDLPRADVAGVEFTSPVRSVGQSYGYSLQEIRGSNAKGKRLDSRKAAAARRANDQMVNSVAWSGDAKSNLPGFLTNTNITAYTIPNGAGGTPQWSTKTPDEILADLNGICTAIIEATFGIEIPDTIIIPIEQWRIITTTPRSSTSDTTIAEFFMKNNPSINLIDWVNDLKLAGPIATPGTEDVIVCYNRSPEKLTLEIPQAFEQLPIQERNLEFVVPTHSRLGGVIMYYPLSAAIGEDI